MANPAPAQPEAPRPWYAGLIGFVFAALVLTAAGLATAASYDGDDDHDDTKGEEHGEDHGDDDDHDDE
jgi:hypothetical protein